MEQKTTPKQHQNNTKTTPKKHQKNTKKNERDQNQAGSR